MASKICKLSHIIPTKIPRNVASGTSKNLSNTLMDRTGTPSYLWFLATEYSVYLLNHLASKPLKWKTPIEVATDETPDISNLLQLHLYQKVYYYDPKSSFPNSKEKLGRFVGIAENVGDMLTYRIQTENHQVISRSVVRPAVNENINLRAEHFDNHDEYELHNDQNIYNKSDVREDV